jgi:hypothetical protein
VGLRDVWFDQGMELDSACLDHGKLDFATPGGALVLIDPNTTLSTAHYRPGPKKRFETSLAQGNRRDRRDGDGRSSHGTPSGVSRAANAAV